MIDGFQEIALNHKSIIESYFQKYSIGISEYSFTNLFMWRNFYQFVWKEENNTIFLLSLKDSSKIIAFPPLGPNLLFAFRHLEDIAVHLSKPLEFHRIPEIYIHELGDLKEKWNISEDRDNWDYVYLVENFANFPGKDFANLRKKLNRFKSRYKWEYISFDQDQINDCMKMQDEWCFIRSCDEDESLFEEHQGIKEIFMHWDVLQYQGGVLRVDGKIIAFTLYDVLNNDTVVCHVEKADPDFIGAYQAIAQQYCEKLIPLYRFVNREQDLGAENLRRSKMNYHPELFLKKFILKRQN